MDRITLQFLGASIARLSESERADLLTYVQQLEMRTGQTPTNYAALSAEAGVQASPTTPTAPSNEMQGTDFHTFASGAKRSECYAERYDLIPPLALRRLALRYGMGAEKYGEWNWQKGLPASDTFNHIIEHLYRWNARRVSPQVLDKPDDDLAGSMWGICALMDYEDQNQAKETRER